MSRMAELALERQEAMGLERQILAQQRAVSTLIADCEFLMKTGVVKDNSADILEYSIALVRDAFEPGAL